MDPSLENNLRNCQYGVGGSCSEFQHILRNSAFHLRPSSSNKPREAMVARQLWIHLQNLKKKQLWSSSDTMQYYMMPKSNFILTDDYLFCLTFPTNSETYGRCNKWLASRRLPSTQTAEVRNHVYLDNCPSPIVWHASLALSFLLPLSNNLPALPLSSQLQIIRFYNKILQPSYLDNTTHLPIPIRR